MLFSTAGLAGCFGYVVVTPHVCGVLVWNDRVVSIKAKTLLKQ